MNISLSNTSMYVITAKNTTNSRFYIRPKIDFENEIKNKSLVVSFSNEGAIDESNIINMISLTKLFFTYDPNHKEYTEVNVINGQLKSVSNTTKVDNIVNLPNINI